MSRALLISVCFHDHRYHGSGAWPPAPARLFQALVAAAADGARIPPEQAAALAWLERLDPPVILAAPARRGQNFRNFVPNNDIDAKGGLIERLAEIRVAKPIRPYLFDAAEALVYCWRFEADPEGHAPRIAALAERLYQLGRGVDMAWARAAILEAEEAERRLRAYDGRAHHPHEKGTGLALACPIPGSLASLMDRHEKMGRRLAFRRQGKKTQILFAQPPKPRFREIPYDAPSERLLFDLKQLESPDRFRPWPLTRAVALVEAVRDAAAERLVASLGEKERARIDRVFGRLRDLSAADKAQRIRIMPLPSIGHVHADPAIRRILVTIPPNCPLRSDDLAWAFSGLHLGSDPATGEVLDAHRPLLLEAADRRMLSHYGIGDAPPARRWQSVTPLALPESARRRRIDPKQLAQERGKPLTQRQAIKTGTERRREEEAAARAVKDALRHAGVHARIDWVRVQREPFSRRGERAEAFAAETRFSKHRLWHVEIAFRDPLAGPLVLGDGRYLGLGVMKPVSDDRLKIARFALRADSAPRMRDREIVLTAVRRALMALDREINGEPLSRLFSGHEPDGRPAGAEDGGHRHVFLIAESDEEGEDAPIHRINVLRPDTADRGVRLSDKEKHRFDAVVALLHLVRAGPLGVLRLVALGEGAGAAPLFARARIWRSRTPYVTTRRPKKRDDRKAFLAADIRAELRRRDLPEPVQVAVGDTRLAADGHLVAEVTLAFAVAVSGPLVLGRLSHRGEGVFAAEQD